MPVPTTKLRMYEHKIQMALDPHTAMQNVYTTEAAYFVEDGTYTLFKGADHSVVAAYKTDIVTAIQRGAPLDDNTRG